MIVKNNWIRTAEPKNRGECVVFVKDFFAEDVAEAVLDITACGVYYAELNGERVGRFMMAPGYTEYDIRHQYQSYDITELLSNGKNHLEVTVAGGWYAGRITTADEEWIPRLIADINIKTNSGKVNSIVTDTTWRVGCGSTLFSDIYDGEIFDATKSTVATDFAVIDESMPKKQLIFQEGEDVIEQERLWGGRILTTPNGETVIDFGQNFAGYPELSIAANAGDEIELSFAEILDKDGNFYNKNYRTAKCIYRYVCRDGFQVHKPRCTFYGFRYIRVDKFPDNIKICEGTFTGVAVYSDIKQTGRIETSNVKLNNLYSNILWGQRSNFLDIPTDCPQRDERLGWTGDAQVFCRTASYNFDVFKFFRKWLRDMDVLRKKAGYVGYCVPGRVGKLAAAWSDAAVIVPWQIYKTYGDKKLLAELSDMMNSHISVIAENSEQPNTWRGGSNLRQFGDWLATDSGDNDKSGEFIHTTKSGATDADFLQAAFYAYDALLLAKTMEALGRDSKAYYELYENIKTQFNKDFPEYHTQTECAVSLRFGLCPNKEQTVKKLAELIMGNGNRMSTGFVGTPHLLHSLSENGYTDLAYTLLLNEDFPSWLYQVNLGATTMWEHWDGIDENGEMWSSEMNSFNHYAYGAVADWIYEVAAGISQREHSAGFENPIIQPHPDRRIGWLSAELDTRFGRISSKWSYTSDDRVRYEITVPVRAEIIIDNDVKSVEKGTYIFVK